MANANNVIIKSGIIISFLGNRLPASVAGLVNFTSNQHGCVNKGPSTLRFSRETNQAVPLRARDALKVGGLLAGLPDVGFIAAAGVRPRSDPLTVNPIASRGAPQPLRQAVCVVQRPQSGRTVEYPAAIPTV
jgi:hypothetical protein